MPFDSLILKWAWQALFLSYTLQIFKKCASLEDAQMVLVPYFAISYGFNFTKNAKTFQSILKQSLYYSKMSTMSGYFGGLKRQQSVENSSE